LSFALQTTQDGTVDTEEPDHRSKILDPTLLITMQIQASS